MTKTKTEKINLNDYLKEITGIAEWFDAREEIDVEEGLLKVRRAAELIKLAKDRLTEVENEFKEIKKETNGKA